MIRQPSDNEALSCVKLLFMSGPNVFRYFFASDETAIQRYLEMLYHKPDILFSKENIWVDALEDSVRGLLLAIPAKDMKQLDENIGNYGREIMQMAGFLNTLKMMFRGSLSKHLAVTHDDEYYISNLAVFGEYRGKGVALALLEQAESLAKERGFPNLSLLVERENARAKSVYERFGFVQTDTVALPKKFEKHNLFGFYKMVKKL